MISQNLNGVLADEMGLGKVRSTKTFARPASGCSSTISLSWLSLSPQANRRLLRHMKLKRRLPVLQTVQAIALLAQMQADGDSRPNLVVAPASILDNWVREIERWLPTATVHKYHGSQKEKQLL